MYPIKIVCLLVSILSQAVFSFLDIEEMKSMKYGIEITNRPVLFSQPPIDDMVHVSSKYGQLYQCRIPFVEVKLDVSKENSNDFSENVRESIVAILDDTLKGECLYHTRGWWTYKFCYKDVIQQYHEHENGVIDGDVLNLGVYESEKDWKGFKVSKKKQKDKLFHQHKYLNGSLCDLTEKFRQSTVKFFCDEDNGNRLVKVEEPSTCSYLISVYSANLCKHPLFNSPEKKKPKEIICSPALNEDQYSKYLAKNQVKSSREIEKTLSATEKKLFQSKKPTKKNDRNSFLNVFQNFLNFGKDKGPDNDKETTGENVILKENIDKAKDADSPTDKKEGEEGDSIKQIVNKETAKAMREMMEGLGIKTDNLKMYGVDSPTGVTKMIMKTDTDNTNNKVSSFEIDDKNQPITDLNKKMDVNDNTNHLDHRADTQKTSKFKKITFEEALALIHDKDKQKDKIASDVKTTNPASVVNKFASELLTSAEKMRDAVEKDLSAEELEKEEHISEASEKLNSGDAVSGDSVKKRLDDLDAFTVTLLERDKEMREVINSRYQRNRQQIKQEIKEMKRLYSEMRRQRKGMGTGKEVEVLDKLITKMRTSIVKYLGNINKLDKKMEQLNELGQQMDQKFGRVMETNKERIQSSSSPNIDRELNALNEVLNNGLNDADSTSIDKNNDLKRKQSDGAKEKNSLSSMISKISKLLKEEKLKKKNKKIISNMKTNDDNKSDLTNDDKIQKEEPNINNGKLESESKTVSSFDDRIKVRMTTLDNKDVKKIFDDDQETDVDQLDDSGLKGKLRRASKKMEDIVKKQLEDAGLKIGSNIRVKILTNRDQLKKIEGDPTMQVLSETETNQFKDMILSLLGGGHEQVKVKKQQKTLEDNYKFTWDENEELSDTNNQRTEKDDDVLPIW